MLSCLQECASATLTSQGKSTLYSHVSCSERLIGLLSTRGSFDGILHRDQILGVLVFAFGGGLVAFVYARHYATKLVVNKNKAVRRSR